MHSYNQQSKLLIWSPALKIIKYIMKCEIIKIGMLNIYFGDSMYLAE